MKLWPRCLHCKEYLDAGAAKRYHGHCDLEHRNERRKELGLKPLTEQENEALQWKRN